MSHTYKVGDIVQVQGSEFLGVGPCSGRITKIYNGGEFANVQFGPNEDDSGYVYLPTLQCAVDRMGDSGIEFLVAP